MKKSGIVILNYNTFEETKECVNSIYEKSPSFYRIYIVDNYSTDDSLEKIKQLYGKTENIVIIANSENKGFSGGNNCGIRAALKDKCDYIFLLNSDIVFLNDALNEMVKSFDNDKVVVVGPSVINRQNEYAQYAKLGITVKSYLLDKKGIRNIFKKSALKNRMLTYDQNKDFVFKGMVSGCCFGVRSSFLNEIGLLDDKVFLYYEEDILSHVICSSDYSCAIKSSAKVLHKEGISTNKISDNKLAFTRFYRWISALYVLKRYTSANRFWIWLIAFSDKFSWRMLSLFKKPYRNRKKEFVTKINEILKIKKVRKK